jgi:hypothetical protein
MRRTGQRPIVVGLATAEGQVVQPIGRYHVLQFDSALEANEFALAIMKFSGSKEGIQFMLDPNRAVIWTPTPPTSSVLYVTDGALAAAKTLGLKYQITSVVARSQLPSVRALYLGDQSDWKP